MRVFLLTLVLTAASAAPADDLLPKRFGAPKTTVYLNGPGDLARLRDTNPRHYARAERVLAAADHLCRPGAGEVQPVVGSRDVHCAGMLLLTSNPPQWRMTFTLDDTRYIALVMITDDPARLIPAR